MKLKRYVRTRDNNIHDMCEFYCKKKEVLKTSDNILDLIKVGDLVKIDNELELVKEINTCYIFTKSWTIHKRLEQKDRVFEITEIYTKQYNNYILVARKTKKGWEVL